MTPAAGGEMLHKLGSQDKVRRPVVGMKLWVGPVGLFVAVGVAYFLAAQLGLALLTSEERVAVFWPASGIAAGILIALGRWARTPVAVAVIAASIVAALLSDRSVWSAVVFALCNAGEALLTMWLIERWFGDAFSIDSLRRVLGFFAAAAVATAIAAVGASGAMKLFGPSTAAFFDVWEVWFASDALGIITVAPLLIGVAAAVRDRPSWRELVEGTVAVVVVTATFGTLVSLLSGPWSVIAPGALIFPVLLWLGYRCRPIFAAAAVFTISAVIVWTTTYEFGRYGDPTQSIVIRVIAAQIAMLGTTLTALVLAALFAEQRRNEATIVASEARLRSILNAANVIAWDVDLIRNAVHPTGPVSRIFDRPEGSEPHDLAGYVESIHPEDRDRVMAQFWRAVSAAATYRLEFRLNSPGQRWVTAQGSIERDADGRPVRVRGITQDMTERKKTELALAEREAQLGLAGKVARVGSFTMDYATERIQSSPGYAVIHGLAEGTEELTREEWLARVHPDDLPRLDALRSQVFAERRRELNIEYRIVGTDGEAQWIESRSLVSYAGDGRPARLVGVHIDITERKRAEDRLQENERKLRDLLGALPAAIYVMDAEGHIIYCNQSAVDLWGREPVLGKDKWSDLVKFYHAGGSPMALADCPTEVALKQGRIERGQEAIIERKDGTRLPIIPYPTPLRDEAGAIIGVVNMTVDISERKKAELALAERNMQLALAGKVALVGSYAYDVDTDVMQVDEGYAALHGLPEGTTSTPRSEWRARTLADDLARVEDMREQAFRERRSEYDVEYRIVCSGGEVRWIESRSFISYSSDGHPQRLVGVNIDITERKKTELTLADRNVQLALAGKAALVGSWAYDTDTEIMQISEGYAAIHGFPEGRTEIRRSECLATAHPDDIGRVEQSRSEAFQASRREYSVEYRIFRPGGDMRWVETRCFITYNDKAFPHRVVGVSIDISERKRVEAQQGRLVAELDHRVKNVLATVQAVAAHTMQASSTMQHFAAALDGRIRSMGSTHELLSQRRWLGIPLAELVERELASYTTGSNTEFGGPEVMLSAEAGQTMAMVLHELVTNAAKYGALSTPSGRVSIRWRLPLNGSACDRLVFTWRETGGPLVAPPSKSSYGMHVVRELIPYQLGGTVDHVLAPEGAQCQMEIPFAQPSADSSKNNGSAYVSPTSDDSGRTRAG